MGKLMGDCCCQNDTIYADSINLVGFCAVSPLHELFNYHKQQLVRLWTIFEILKTTSEKNKPITNEQTVSAVVSKISFDKMFHRNC